MDKLWVISFFPSKKNPSKSSICFVHKSSSWHISSIGAVIIKNYTELEKRKKYIQKTLQTSSFLQKVMNFVESYQKFWKLS